MKPKSWKGRLSKGSHGAIRRYSPLVIGATLAGATSFPTSSLASCVNQQSDKISAASACVARTGGAVIAAWAIGTLAEATRPNSGPACDLSHVCDLVISSEGGSGTGTGATIKFLETNSSSEVTIQNVPFTLNETIDYQHPVIQNAAGNSCYPASGSLEITDSSTSPASHLNLDVVGQGCRVGKSAVQLIVTGSYVTSASDGEFSDADGIGSLNINNPTGLSGTAQNAKASLTGQLEYGE